jgi:DUF4097 and DUF4098 domain-containing protein YvlB
MKSLAILLLCMPIVHNSMGGDLDVDAAPHGAVLRTMGGDIRVGSAGGDIVAKTMGGNIRVSRLDGSIDAGTMGGNIDVEVLGAGTDRSIHLASMGGSIEVSLPKDFAADFEVELEEDNDRGRHEIRSDFPLHIEESTHRRLFRKVRVLTATGKNGTGGNRVRIWTIGSDITIHRR